MCAACLWTWLLLCDRVHVSVDAVQHINLLPLPSFGRSDHLHKHLRTHARLGEDSTVRPSACQQIQPSGDPVPAPPQGLYQPPPTLCEAASSAPRFAAPVSLAPHADQARPALHTSALLSHIGPYVGRTGRPHTIDSTFSLAHPSPSNYVLSVHACLLLSLLVTVWTRGTV